MKKLWKCFKTAIKVVKFECSQTKLFRKEGESCLLTFYSKCDCPTNGFFSILIHWPYSVFNLLATRKYLNSDLINFLLSSKSNVVEFNLNRNYSFLEFLWPPNILCASLNIFLNSRGINFFSKLLELYRDISETIMNS